MDTNEILLDEAIRHSVNVQRLGGGMVRRMLKLLKTTEKDVLEKLLARIGSLSAADIENIRRNGDATSKRLLALYEQIDVLSDQYQEAIEKPLKTEMLDLAKHENGYYPRELKESVSIDHNFTGISQNKLKRLVSHSPIEGLAGKTFDKRISEWSDKVKDKVIEGLRVGFLQGETLEQMKTRISKVTRTKKKHLEAIIRTSANHVSNQVKFEVAQANNDVVAMLQWRSVLDKKTSDICNIRDGELYDLSNPKIPPAHPNCRSILVFVTRAALALDKFKKGRTRASMTGQVPADLNYNQWLARQSDQVIRDYIGPERFRLWKTGLIELDQFYDKRNEKRYTLDQLRNREPQAFIKSGSKLQLGRFERDDSLNERDMAIETLAYNRILSSERSLLDQYRKKHGKVVNTDDFRPLFAADGYKGTNAAAVHEPSSYLAKKAYEAGLQNPEPNVAFTAGGAGTGKSSAIKKVPKAAKSLSEAAVVLDTNLSGFQSGMNKIKQAHDQGKTVTINYVYRSPEDSFENGVVKRMLNNVNEGGRLVPASRVAENHYNSWEVVKRIADLKIENLEINYIDNSLGFGNAKITTRSSLNKKITYSSEKALYDQFKEIVDRLYREGVVNQEQYEELIK